MGEDKNNVKDKPKPNLGDITRALGRLEEYSDGSWIRITLGSGFLYGRKKRINHETGEIIFDKTIESVYNEKGRVLDIVENLSTYRILEIGSHQLTTEEKVQETIDNQSPLYSRFDKYIELSIKGNTRIGKVFQLFPNYVELKPFVNSRGDQYYIEEAESICVPINNGISIIPSTRQELEFIVDKMNRSKEKSTQGIILLS